MYFHFSLQNISRNWRWSETWLEFIFQKRFFPLLYKSLNDLRHAYLSAFRFVCCFFFVLFVCIGMTTTVHCALVLRMYGCGMWNETWNAKLKYCGKHFSFCWCFSVVECRCMQRKEIALKIGNGTGCRSW